MEQENKPIILSLEKFYKGFNPNITTSRNGIVYFNSDDQTEDNAYPQKLQDAYRKSSVHANFVNLKANLTYGSGLFAVNDSPEVNQFLASENRAGQTLDDVFQKASFDMSMFESACIQVVYSSENKIVEAYHTCPAYIRAEEPDEFGIINNWYYSTTWGDVTNAKKRKKTNDVKDATIIPTFNPKNGAVDGRQLLYIKRYSATNEIYPQPMYTSAFNFIELENTLSDYIVNKIAGGFYPSGIFYLNSSMSPEDRDKFVSDFNSKHIGPKQAGKVIFIFGDTNNAKPEYVKLSDELGNGLVRDLITTSQLQISIAHGGSTSLLGVDIGDTFGGSADSNRLNITRLYFIDSVIRGYQTTLLKSFNKIMAVNGLSPLIVNNDSLKLQQPIVEHDDLTQDEIREIVYGLPPMAKAISSTGSTVTNNINPPSIGQ